MKRFLIGIACCILSLDVMSQEVLMRHALEGRSLDALATLVVRFNDEQKGKANARPRVVLQGLAGVEDPRQLPHMALLDANDSRAFFASQPRFRPLAQVMAEAGEKLDSGRFLPQIADAADDASGRLQALPIGMALPVLFYNKDAFRKAGLDPEAPPKTWLAVQKAAGDLYDAGFTCPLTSSRFNWIHLENVASQHGEPILVRGAGGKAHLNSMVHVKHIALLSSWNKSLYFHYFGPGNEGDARFASGECAMLTGESSLYAELARAKRFDFGVAGLPYYDDVYGATPYNVLPDGAALWVLAGHGKAEYRVVARFASFLLRPENQRDWVGATGYLPMTPAAIEALKSAGVAPAAVLDAAQRRLSAPRVLAARPKNGPWRDRMHEILDEEIIFVWKNTKPAKEALDTAMLRSNVDLPAMGKGAGKAR
jgi:sn-glycerol 3-phosphate transport system substrate-binding protein